MEWVKIVEENYGTISVVAIAVFGLLAKLRRYVNGTIASVLFSVKLHDLFGDNPAQSLKDFCVNTRKDLDTNEIRIKIIERLLKIGIFISGVDGKYLFTNEAFNELFGLDSQEMIGFGWLQSVQYNDRKKVHEEWLYAVKEGIEYNASYTIINHRTQEEIPIMVAASPVFNDKNEKVCHIGCITIHANN